MAMAMKKAPPKKRVSTPCAKVPVRTVAQRRLGVEGDYTLKEVGDEEYFTMVANTTVSVGSAIPDTNLSPLPTSLTSTAPTSKKLTNTVHSRHERCWQLPFTDTNF